MNTEKIQADFVAEREAELRLGLQRRGTVFLEDLPAGERFIYEDRGGTILHVGPSGVTVRFDGRREVDIKGKKITRPLAPVQFAGQTEVLWEAP